MYLSTKNYCVFLLLYVLAHSAIKAQPALRDSVIRDSGYAVALEQYHAAVHPETNLYRGEHYLDYHQILNTGDPYFIDSVISGSIWYNGLQYRNVPLIYDLVLGLIVIRDPAGNWRLGLNSRQVDSFTVGDARFIRLRDSLNPSAPRNGFYQLLYRGRVMLLKRHIKYIQADPSAMALRLERSIQDLISYWLKKGDTYYPVNSKGGLAAALKGRPVKKFIHSNHLSFRKDKENTLIKALSWYDATDK